MSKLIPCIALLCSALTGCTSSEPSAPGAREPELPPVQRVVVISVDGLRGDALAQMPALAALRARAAWTDSMVTVAPSLTVPGHLAMFTGRDVTQFGVTTNILDQSSGIALYLAGATSMFQWIAAAGGTSVALVGTSLIPASDLEQARGFFGIGEIVSVSGDLDTLRARALDVATGSDAPTLLFVHVPTVDFAGHDFGWIRTDSTSPAGGDVLGAEYLAAARGADAMIEAVWRALQPAIDRGEVALVVTSDHGGGHGDGCTLDVAASREHCTAHSADRTIPFVLVANHVAAGRLAGQPTIMQVAPTVASVLGITRPGATGAALR